MDLKNENSLVVAFDNFDDQVTDMVHLPYRKQLICCSGDGTFMVIDLKRKRIVSHSNSCDDEFTAIAAVKNGDHILLGSGLGEVSILKYNYWGEFADRLPAHPGTVNCLLAESFHSTVFYTGCSDGTIRKLQIHPNEIIAEVGHLNDSVERMALFNPDEETSFLLAATCEDGVLRAFELGDADDDDNEGSKIIRKRGKKVLPSVVKLNSSHRAFFADL